MASKPGNTINPKKILNERGEKIRKPIYAAPPNPFKKSGENNK